MPQPYIPLLHHKWWSVGFPSMVLKALDICGDFWVILACLRSFRLNGLR